MEEEFDTVLYLLDELKAEDHNTRLHAINSLEQIAGAIGEARTRKELIPYFNELLEDDNQEVLLAIANKLGELADYIGEPKYMDCLIPALKCLVKSEEQIVQEKAIKSINKILQNLPIAILQDQGLNLVNELANQEQFSGRVAACYLFYFPLTRLPLEKQNELIDVFIKLAKDESYLVRKAAADSLGQICFICENGDLLRLFESLCTDDYDCIRQMALESVAKLLGKYRELSNYIRRYPNDKS